MVNDEGEAACLSFILLHSAFIISFFILSILSILFLFCF
jgi:hypothetical protein